MKREHPFRIKKRTLNSGNISYRVIFDFQPWKTYSSGKDSYEGAVAWAYQNMHRVTLQKEYPSFGEFSKDFFIPGTCKWTDRKLRHGSTFGQNYFPQRRGILLNHLIPRLRDLRLDSITAAQIDDILLDTSNKSTGAPLAPHTLERTRMVLRIIFGEAVFQGILRDNPADHVPPFYGTANPHQPFTLAEIHQLFPEDIDEGLQIWKSLEWYGYFLMQWSCGVRPGEAAAFMLRDWIRDQHGAVIKTSVEARTRKIKGLKTENKGMMAKPVIFNQQLETIFTMLEYNGRAPDVPVFILNNRTIELNTANKHLKSSAREAGLDLSGRAQYSFRHTFYTELLKRLPVKDVEKMAGHKKLRKEYDHRQGVDFLKEAEPLRKIINQL